MIYWWNPLVVLSFFVEGHNDLLGLALLLLAIWLLGRGRRLGAGGAAGLAVAAKIFPLAALPSYARKAGVAPLLAGAAAALGSAWLFLTPQLDIFRSLVRFGGELSYNDSIHALVERGLAFVGLDGGLGSRAVVASLWFAVALLVARTTSAASNELARARGAAVSIGALLLLLPTAHPWYFTLIVPFLCFFSWTGWIAMSGMAVLPHLAQLEIAHTGTWVEWHALKWIEYGPLFGWLSWRASLRMTGSVRATPSGPVARAREES